MNRKIQTLRLELAYADARVEDHHRQLAEVIAQRDNIAARLKRAVFADAAGYGDTDAPSRPRRSSYTDDAAGEAAFARAEERWRVFSQLAATEWPDWHLDFVEAVG